MNGVFGASHAFIARPPLLSSSDFTQLAVFVLRQATFLCGSTNSLSTSGVIYKGMIKRATVDAERHGRHSEEKRPADACGTTNVRC